MSAGKSLKNSGFTLIELVLVVSLLLLVVGVSSDIIISLVRSYSKTQVINEIEQTANFVVSKLEKELRVANSIAIPNSSTLSFYDPSGQYVQYNFYSASKYLTRYAPPGNYIKLTDTSTSGGGVEVTCPSGCFTLVSTSPQVVRITMTFSQAGSAASKFFTNSVNIDTTVVARGTY